MINLRHSLTFALLAAPRLALASEPMPATPAEPGEKTDLFRAAEGGYAMYRIPGIVVTGRGTILVYCEARAGQGDWTRQDVLLRRSTDGGRTWSPPRKMAVAPPDLQPNPAAVAQGLANHSELTAHNAVAIVDQDPGVVHFLYHVQYARVFYVRSEDDGQSWSQPREITAVIDGFRDRYDWRVVGNGCGHAIQLRQGPHRGRLVLAMWLSIGTGGHAHRPSDVAVIYSDDRGQTWQRGEFIAHNGDRSASGDPIVNPSETMLIELAGGRVLANLRTESPRHRRLLAASPDGATGWSTPAFHEQLVEPICMASTLRLEDGRILFSNPDNLLVGGKPGQLGRNRDRCNVTIKLSDDDGGSWRPAAVVEPGPSGYSDLAAGPDGTIYCFYERGGIKGNHYHTEALTLAKYSLDQRWRRPSDPQHYDQQGHALYYRMARSESFLQGIDRLVSGMNKYRVAIMCSEEDPAVCHRFLLVSRVMAERGTEIQHIRGDGSLASQDRIRAAAGGPRQQGLLFPELEDDSWRSLRSVLPKAQPPNSSED